MCRKFTEQQGLKINLVCFITGFDINNESFKPGSWKSTVKSLPKLSPPNSASGGFLFLCTGAAGCHLEEFLESFKQCVNWGEQVSVKSMLYIHLVQSVLL